MILSEITVTSFRIMGNIHPNPNHPPEPLHVMAHDEHDELRLYTFVTGTPLKIYKIYFAALDGVNNTVSE